jgi:hypothetical protein
VQQLHRRYVFQGPDANACHMLDSSDRQHVSRTGDSVSDDTGMMQARAIVAAGSGPRFPHGIAST